MWTHHKKRGLRNWVLLTLRGSPRSGAEIMNAMEQMTHGWWRPSPGSIYPLLEEMAREGTVRRREDGRYELTDASTQDPMWAWMNTPRTPKDVANELAGLASYLEDLRRTDPSACAPIAEQLKSVVDRLDRLAK
jgi:DNA-binding PadR family transcriptional regulator